MTHYETLGVTDSATADEIRMAYKRLALKHHPDRGGDTETFQNIQAAYNVLADDASRQQYDAERRNPGRQNIHFQWHSHDGSIDINNIFRQFGFGNTPFQAGFAGQPPRKNRDLRVRLEISLADTLNDQRKTISVSTTTGERYTVEVNIPRGVTQNTSIKYPGLGDNMFNTIPRGDLYVQIAIFDIGNFEIHDIDLHTNVIVNCILAITGGSVQVAGIDGTVFAINVPAGTQPGLKFRISGQGLYLPNSPRRGDLYVELKVSIPQNLSDEQINTLKTLLTNL
jgi:DnaJ-class molecular chaperone